MSTLISSAVGGKKAAAPKGAVRRRQPPPPGAPEKAAVPVTAQSAQSSVAPPSPPPTQAAENTVLIQPEDVRPTAPQISSEPQQTTPIPILTPSATIEQATPEPSTRSRQAATANETQASEVTEPLQLERTTSSTALATSRKRKQGSTQDAEEPAVEPPKKAKRSSARSNNQVQAAVQETEVVQPGTAKASVAQSTQLRQQGPSAEPSSDAAVAASSVSAANTRSNKQAAGARFQLTPSTTTKKRKAEPAQERPEAQPVKKTKQTSARSNTTVQAAIQEDQPASATTPVSNTQKKGSAKQSVAAVAVAAPTEKAASNKAEGKAKETSVAKVTEARQKAAPKAKKTRSVTKETASTEKPAPKRRTKQKAAATAIDPAIETASEATNATQQTATPTRQPAKPKRQQSTRRTRQELEQAAAQNEPRSEAEEEDQESEDESDPELHEIDPNTVTMWEVGGNKRRGKTSEREKKMAAIDWGEVKQRRLEEIQRIIEGEQPAQPPATSKATGDDAIETTEGPSGTAESQPVVIEDEEPDQLTMRNGEIVENETNLIIDRRELIEKEIAENPDPIVEDTDLTTRMNRTTFIHSRKRNPKERLPMARAKSDPWSEEETERFYEALRMFGTDFGIISHMFPPRTRRHIKMKFVREERLDPIRVDRALGVGSGGGAAYGGRKEMDLEHYAREVGTEVEEFNKFESLEEAEAEIRESYAAQAEAAEKARQEREQLDDAAQTEEGLREADKTAKKAKKQQSSKKKGEGQAQRGRKKTAAGGEKAKATAKSSAGAAQPKKKGVGRPKKGAKGAAAATAEAVELVEIADG